MLKDISTILGNLCNLTPSNCTLSINSPQIVTDLFVLLWQYLWDIQHFTGCCNNTNLLLLLQGLFTTRYRPTDIQHYTYCSHCKIVFVQKKYCVYFTIMFCLFWTSQHVFFTKITTWKVQPSRKIHTSITFLTTETQSIAFNYTESVIIVLSTN